MPREVTMATENDSGEERDDEGEEKPEGGSKKDPHLERTIKERDRAKARNRELEAKLAEAQTAIDEIAALKEKAADDEARAKNDFAAIEAKLKKDADKERAEKQAAQDELAALKRGARETALVDAVAGKAGVSRVLVKGLLRVASEQGFDNAPEAIDDSTVADAIKLLRDLEPELIKTRNSGSAGTPGTTTKNKAAGEDPSLDGKRAKAREAAEAMSSVRKRPEKE